MLIPGRHYNSEKYRFAFQGQEKDDEIKGSTGTSYAYKFRMHDPRIGRFWSIDPLSTKYPFYSPYAFSGNRVIDMVELEGLEPNYTPDKIGATAQAGIQGASDNKIYDWKYNLVSDIDYINNRLINQRKEWVNMGEAENPNPDLPITPMPPSLQWINSSGDATVYSKEGTMYITPGIDQGVFSGLTFGLYNNNTLFSIHLPNSKDNLTESDLKLLYSDYEKGKLLGTITNTYIIGMATGGFSLSASSFKTALSGSASSLIYKGLGRAGMDAFKQFNYLTLQNRSLLEMDYANMIFSGLPVPKFMQDAGKAYIDLSFSGNIRIKDFQGGLMDLNARTLFQQYKPKLFHNQIIYDIGNKSTRNIIHEVNKDSYSYE